MAGTRRITVLQHISHEVPEGEKWQVNDVANISTKLFMASFYTSFDNKIYVSVYSAEGKKVQEKHSIEVSTQKEPHSVLMNKDGSTLVVCVGMNIQFYQASNGTLQKTVSLEEEPSCTCRGEEGLLVATNNSSTIQSFNFEAIQTKQVVLEGLDQVDYPSDMTMVGDVIYLCTHKTGQAFSYDQYGVKLSAFKSNDEQNSQANSIEVHGETELVFILWNECNVLVYSHLSNESLISVDATCATKMRLIDDHMMIQKVPETNEILVYDVETLIDFAMLKEQFLATLEEKVWNYMLTDSKPHEPRQSLSSSKSSFNQKVSLTVLQQQKDLFRTFDAVQIQYANYNAKQETTGRLSEEVQTETLIDFAMLKEQFLATLEEKVRKDVLTDTKMHEPCQSKSSSKSPNSDKSSTKKTFSFRKNKEREQQKKLLKLFNELQVKYEKYKANIETTERQLHEIKTEDYSLKKSEKRKLVLEKDIKKNDTRLLEEERKDDTNLKEVEERNTKLVNKVTHLKEKLREEEKRATELQTISLKVETNLKEVEERNTTLEDEVTQLKERLLVEEKTAKEMQTSSLKVVTNLKKVEESNTKHEEVVTQLQEKLPADEWKVEKIESHLQKLVTNLKKMKEIGTKIEEEVTQSKEKLLENEWTAKKVVSPFLKFSMSNDWIKYLECIGWERRSQNNISKDNLFEENDGVTREERSGVQNLKLVTNLKKAEESNTKHEEEVTQLQESLPAEERTAKTVEPHFQKVVTNLKKLEESNTKHEEEVTQLQESLPADEKTAKTVEPQFQKFSRSYDWVKYLECIGWEPRNPQDISKDNLLEENDRVTREERSLVQLSEKIKELEGIIKKLESQQKKSKDNLEEEKENVTREERSRVQDAQSYLSDSTSDTATVKGDSDEEEVLDEQSKLEVCTRVSVEGANLQIADTGVSLSIPPGALSEEKTIHMKILSQPCDPQAPLRFACNSTVVVELLPSNCRFHCPVSLTLPHCLKLKKEYETNSIDVLISHHDKGIKPKWEILHDARFNLCEESCTIFLHSFCWVTYEMHDTIVEAKRIKLYTAGKKMRLNDRITEVEVGFYPDLPGSGKILELNKDMHLSQRKPYVFLKKGEEPLLINLHKVVPKEWNNSQPDENPKIIPFDSVSISEERSCPFVLERSGDDTDIPLCIFKVGQKGRSKVELTIRPDVLTP